MVSSRETATYPTEHIHFHESLAATPTHRKLVTICVYSRHFQKAFNLAANCKATVLTLCTLYIRPWPYVLVNYFIPLSPSLFLFKDSPSLFYFLTDSFSIFMFGSAYFLEITAFIITFTSLFPKPFPNRALGKAALSWFPPHFSP